MLYFRTITIVAAGSAFVASSAALLAYRRHPVPPRTLAAQSTPAQITFTDTRNGEVLDVKTVLKDASTRDLWLVAHDSGRYALEVGGRCIGVDIVPVHEIEIVLSHRWSPLVETEFGPVPAPMLEASYPKRTWVDILNHFNDENQCLRVLHEMGALYASKVCRALFFEDPDFAVQAESCARAWMWQELSLGPQQHNYHSPRSVWLHFAVMVGPDWVYRSAQSLSIVVVRLVHCAGGSALRRWAEFIFSFLEKGKNSMQARIAVPKPQPHCCMVLLESLLAEEGFAECGETVQRIGDELQRSDLTQQQQVLQAALLLNAVVATMCDSASAVMKQQRFPQTTANAAVAGFAWLASGPIGVPAFVGWAEAPHHVHAAAKRMLLGSMERDDQRLSSAVANMGNSAVTFPADCLPASFGVFCSMQGVKLAPAAISALIESASTARIRCYAGDEAQGVAVLHGGELCYSLLRFRRTSRLVHSLSQLPAGSLFWDGECDAAVLSATTSHTAAGGAAGAPPGGVLSLGACHTVCGVAGLTLAGRALWRGLACGAGRLDGYELASGTVVLLTVALEGGGILTLEPTVPVDQRRFFGWMAARP